MTSKAWKEKAAKLRVNVVTPPPKPPPTIASVAAEVAASFNSFAKAKAYKNAGASYATRSIFGVKYSRNRDNTPVPVRRIGGHFRP